MARQVLGRPPGRMTDSCVLVRRAAFVGLNTTLYSLLLDVESEGECKLVVRLEAKCGDHCVSSSRPSTVVIVLPSPVVQLGRKDCTLTIPLPRSTYLYCLVHLGSS